MQFLYRRNNMGNKFLDSEGLAILWEKIKDYANEHLGGYKVEIVTSLPSTIDENTIYLVKEE